MVQDVNCRPTISWGRVALSRDDTWSDSRTGQGRNRHPGEPFTARSGGFWHGYGRDDQKLQGGAFYHLVPLSRLIQVWALHMAGMSREVP